MFTDFRTPVQWALYYANRGWRVFPAYWVTASGGCSCGIAADYQDNYKDLKHAIGKHPFTEHGHKDATTSQVQIMRWWLDWPLANVGIATGQESKIIVVDVDKKSGGLESLSWLEKRHGALPHTIRANTGGGGYHIYFEAPMFEIRGRRAMLPGIDVMADGGRVISPPSLHKSGKQYEWDSKHHPDNNFPVALPAWLLNRIRTKFKSKARRLV